jgi:hypothetical protein
VCDIEIPGEFLESQYVQFNVDLKKEKPSKLEPENHSLPKSLRPFNIDTVVVATVIIFRLAAKKF